MHVPPTDGANIVDRVHRRLLRDNRGQGDRSPATIVAATVGPVQPGGSRLRARLRLRRRTTGARGRRRQVGDGGTLRRRLRAAGDRLRASGGRLRAVHRVQAGPVGVRGLVVPAGGTAAPLRPDGPTRAHGGAEGDGRRAVRRRAQNVRGRARPRAGASAPRVRSDRGGAGPVLQLLSSGRPQVEEGRVKKQISFWYYIYMYIIYLKKTIHFYINI